VKLLDLAPEWPENPILRMYAIAGLLRLQGAKGCVAADWLAEGLERHVSKAEELGRALGFTGENSGRKSGSWRREILLAQRDRLLVAALGELHGNAAQLAREIDVYLTRVPPASKLRRDPDPGWCAARRLIHAANHLDVGLPGTSVGLRKRVEKETEGGDVQFREFAGSSIQQDEIDNPKER
jgi:hypothetical protein